MNISEYKNIYRNEGSHFYYVATHKLILSLVKKYLLTTNHQPQTTILDAGCGTGLLAKKLERLGKVTAVDFSDDAVKFAKKRGVKVIKASVTQLPFAENSFNVVTSVDVIYHDWVEDDQKALSEFYRVLKHGGNLVLKVPALRVLNLKHDKYVFTKRRYSKKELRVKLIKAGFKIEKLTYINFILLKLALVKLIWEKIFPSRKIESNVGQLPNLINQIAEFILSLEYRIAMIIRLPIGMGLITVAKKC